MKVLVAADDLTGGNGTAALLADRGFRVWVHLVGEDVADRAAATQPAMQTRRATGTQEAHVYDLATRNLSEAQAAAAVGAFSQSISHAAWDLVALRIDSTLRGPIAASLNALLAQDSRRIAVVVPAHPRSGRTTVAGVQLVHGVPVHETSVGADPFAPVRDSRLASWIGLRCDAPSDSVPMAAVAAGAGAVCAAFAAGYARGARIWFCDAASPGDIDTLAEAALQFCAARPGVRLLTVDPGPFTAAVASRMRKQQAEGDSGGAPPPVADTRCDPCPAEAGRLAEPRVEDAPGAPRILGISASLMAEAKGQMDALARMPGVCMVRYNGESPASVVRQMREQVAMVSANRRGLCRAGGGASPVLVVRTDTWESPAGGARAVQQRLPEIVRAAVAAFPSLAGFYLSGGEAARAILAGVGVSDLAMKREVAPITTLSVPVNGLLRGKWVLTKGGTMGDRMAAVAAIHSLYSAITTAQPASQACV
ncbi:MAG: four-carbon acid sugar kinase family protein [Alicyclobacillus sp.]|nr:four-carbon acid sugar kinase family protein [Alicyclobacillus sp.]